MQAVINPLESQQSVGEEDEKEASKQNTHL